MRAYLIATFVMAFGSAPAASAAWQGPGLAPEAAERARAAAATATRPGDEAMTCDSIIAEMKTLQATGVSRETRTEAQAAGEDLRAAINRKQQVAAGQMAAGTAATAAASGAAAAGAQGADAALLAGQVAAQAQGARNVAELKPKRERAERAIGAATAELYAGMQANPRFGRLIELAGAKGCSGDF